MEQIADGVYRLGRKYHNFYLIVVGGRATVVDAGGSRELPLLEKGLSRLGLGLDSVEALLLTHAHSDHIGFARVVQKRGVSVKSHEAEAAFAVDSAAGSQIGMLEVPLWKPRVILFMVEMIRAGAHRAYRLPNIETVADGERLELPGRPQVVATPGHTAGHASYWFEGSRVLCSGDALVTDGVIAGGLGPQVMADVFHLDPALARESLDRLGGIDADVLLPGHGDPWRGSMAEAVRRARVEV